MRLSWLHSRLRAIFRREVVERETEEELRFHVDAYIQDLVRGGLERGEAEQQALCEFGGLQQAKEECREVTGMALLDSLGADIRYGMRMLRRSPGFAIVAVLTLALGIGATTAIFSVMNAVLLRSLPYHDPRQLVFLYEPLPGIPGVPLQAWGPVNGDFFDWQKQSHGFSSMAMFTDDRLNVSTGDVAFRALGSRVTGDFFRVLQARPELGRTLDAVDSQPGRERIVVISHALWASRFGGDRHVLGKQLLLNAKPFRIVGVMPTGFAFPHGTESLETIGKTTDIWVPWAMTQRERASRDDDQGNAIGRLRRGVTLSQAQAEIATITARFPPPYQQQPQKAEGVVRSFEQTITGGSRRPLLVLMVAVLLVLLIACSNVASLMLARLTARTHEISMRAVLGASRLRLARQLLIESSCVAFAGGVLGIVISVFLLRLLIDFSPANIPRIGESSIDTRVLLFAVAISAATAVLSGVFPAWSGARRGLGEAVKGSATRSIKGGGSYRLHGALIIAEIALTITLLTGSGLLIRSFFKLRAIDKGFSSESTVSMNINLYGRYNQAQKENTFFQDLLNRIQAIPGVRDAAAIDHVPLGGGESLTLLQVEGYSFDAKRAFESRCITPRYFATMGIPLLQGRDFDKHDRDNSPPVIVVSRSFARTYFPGRSALGRRVHTSGLRTIVGVVADVREGRLDATPPMQIYLPLWQTGTASASLVVRSTFSPDRMATIVRGFVRHLDPALAVSGPQTMDELVSGASAERRFQTMLLSAFGGIALFLSLVGLYALMVWSVRQRIAEIGLRMALGAQPRTVLALIFRQGAALWLSGLALGLACALILTRWIRSLLFETPPADPATFLSIGLLFCAVAAAACYLPARRATRVDPAISLRAE